MTDQKSARPTDALSQQAYAEIHDVLAKQSEFVKVHAAEYLIWLGEKDEAKKVFLREEELHHTVPKYRVVVWRVLAQTETEPKAKKKWTDQVFQSFADPDGPDRIHAAETLGKLKLSPMAAYAAATNQILTTEKENLYVYTLWASSHASPEAYEKNKTKFLNFIYHSENEDLRRISAFVLRREGKLNQKEWDELALRAIVEASSPMGQTLLNTAFATATDNQANTKKLGEIRSAMLANPEKLKAAERIELALVLADHGDQRDLPLLKGMLENQHSNGIYEVNSAVAADVRATAAYAILKINKRK